MQIKLEYTYPHRDKPITSYFSYPNMDMNSWTELMQSIRTAIQKKAKYKLEISN